MYELVTIEHILRIPPEKFGQPKELSAYELLREEYEGIIDKNLGFVIAVVDVIEVGLGKIIHGDARTHHSVKFTILTFKPMLHEIIEGEVVEVVEFGAFIRFGPRTVLTTSARSPTTSSATTRCRTNSSARKPGGPSGKEIKSGRASSQCRWAAVRGPGSWRCTMRQPFLGKLSWIEEDIKAQTGGATRGETPAKEEGAESAGGEEGEEG